MVPIPEITTSGDAEPLGLGEFTRSSLPASDDCAAAAPGLPASPVSTSIRSGAVNSMAPRLPVAPFGIPVSTGFGGPPPWAIRTTRLSLGVVM